MMNRLVYPLLIFSAYILVCALGYLGFTTSQQNSTGWFLLLTAVAYGLGGPYLLISHLKKEPIRRQESQSRSFWMLIPGFLVVFYISPLEFLILRIFPNYVWAEWVGILLIIFSLILFSWARLTLRTMYSGLLRVKADHVLVQTGPYRFIRHPAYAAYLLMCLGVAIGYTSVIGLLATLFLLLPAFIYRIRVEEELLSSEFPADYPQYAQNTKKLLPGIW